VTIYLHVAPSTDRHITSLCISLKFYHLSSTLKLSIYKFDPYPLVQDDLHWRMLLRGAYGLSPRTFIGRQMLQFAALPRTAEASTRERWRFGALTNRKATSSNRDPSLTSLFDSTSHHFQLSIGIATTVTGDHSATALYCYYVALSLYRDKYTTIIRLW